MKISFLSAVLFLQLTTSFSEPLARFKRDGNVDWDEILRNMPDEFVANDIIGGEDENGLHLDPDDFNRAIKVEDIDPIYDEGVDEDPILMANGFEGDILNVTREDIMDLMQRNAIKNQRQQWPNNQVPYVISSQYSSYERSVIASAFQEYHEKTCIKFVPRTNQRDYIHIVKGSGCSSSVGRVGGGQQVSLGRGCVYKGIVEHELMHALGFWHEQSRADRDDNVQIVWDNIQSSMKYNFMKYTLSQIQHLNAPYDTCSVMHYNGKAFSRNGGQTIKKRKSGGCTLGQRKGFSEMDVKKINTLYSCDGYPQTTGGSTKPQPKPTTVPTVKPDLSCQDTNQYCATWATNGECEANPAWMLKNCPVSCKECKIKCADHNQFCAEWKKRGECSKNSEYMNIYCARSCGICTAQGCKDENDYCASWAKSGYCTSSNYANYMKLRCKASCGFC